MVRQIEREGQGIQKIAFPGQSNQQALHGSNCLQGVVEDVPVVLFGLLHTFGGRKLRENEIEKSESIEVAQGTGCFTGLQDAAQFIANPLPADILNEFPITFDKLFSFTIDGEVELGS
jgi:hypothetical protein